MSQLNENLGDMRMLLMWPTRESLDDGTGYQILIRTIDELVTLLNQTGEPHFLMHMPINVTAGKSVYPLDGEGSFGRARYLYSIDTGNSNHYREQIELVPYEALTALYGGGDPAATAAVPSSFPNVARAAAVYFLQSSPGPGNFLEIGPVPGEASTYRLTYEPDVVRPQAKEDQGFRLKQFDNYVSTLSALRALPHCRWKGLDSDATRERKAELRQSFAYDIGSIKERRGYEYLFWMYRQSATQNTKPATMGWAQNRW